MHYMYIINMLYNFVDIMYAYVFESGSTPARDGLIDLILEGRGSAVNVLGKNIAPTHYSKCF